MKQRLVRALRGAGCVLCGAGCLFFLLPLLRGGFALGSTFGSCVCLLGLFLLLFYRRLSRRGGWVQAAARLTAAFYCLGLCWAAYLSGLMLSAAMGDPPQGANVIVLGARTYGPEEMSRSLQNRVERAFSYLEENPEALCIVTGGQGADEPCPEALTQKNVLTKLGIDPARVFVEDQSHNTRENFRLAHAIAQEQGMGEEVAVVTQGFHMFRAMELARAAGFSPYALVAETDPLLFPEYYGRELLSLTKWHAERLVIE